ncbi:MAG TPA: hypothetical protein VG895_02250 [Patescibacteria group bacterium]|nr:hypothetical protein [Patescibacteria group bacterium]
MKKKLGIGCLGVIVILVVLGVIGAAGSSKNSKVTTSNNNALIQPTSTPEAITASQIADDFDTNQVAAKDKWNNKVVQFSAQISNITDSGISFYNVATKQYSMTQINCNITDKSELIPLKNGQTVTVKGTVGGQTIGVIKIDSCEVVQ